MNDRKQVLLRIDPAVHDALAQWAADEFRSLNAHIELLLRLSPRQGGANAQEGWAVAQARPAFDRLTSHPAPSTTPLCRQFVQELDEAVEVSLLIVVHGQVAAIRAVKVTALW